MKPTKQPSPTASALLRALVDAINKDEHWSRELYRAHKAATEFLNKKGPRQ
jgi:hypothetical protein